MSTRDVVVVAASAGGIEALRELLGSVPADYGGVILVVLHVPAGGGRARNNEEQAQRRQRHAPMRARFS